MQVSSVLSLSIASELYPNIGYPEPSVSTNFGRYCIALYSCFHCTFCAHIWVEDLWCDVRLSQHAGEPLSTWSALSNEHILHFGRFFYDCWFGVLCSVSVMPICKCSSLAISMSDFLRLFRADSICTPLPLSFFINFSLNFPPSPSLSINFSFFLLFCKKLRSSLAFLIFFL